MKKLLFLAGLTLLTFSGFAQGVDLRNRIEVTGSAEQEVTPDIIYVSISLKEYLDGKTKITINQLESQLEKAVSDAGVPKADFTINNVSAYNYTYQKKKNPDFLAAKQYQLKLHDLNRLDQILAKVDAKGIQATNIDSYDYSKMNDLKRDLKIKALLAAREKASYLTASIGEKLGGAIDITENDDVNMPAARPVMYMAKRAEMDSAPMPESDINFKTIKLNFTVRAVFEILK